MTDRGQVDVLLPGPSAGSGGIRTAVAAAEAMAAVGYPVTLHVEIGNASPRKAAAMVDRTRDWFEVRRCAVSSGWPDTLTDSAMVLGTTWRSAAAAAAIDTAAVRAHFVQDYECWFYPRDDDFLAAAGVFDLGLSSVVIGEWLPQVLWRHHGLAARSVPFTADLDVYHPGSQPDVPTVVAMYQPEKPRRCGRLMKASLQRLLEIHPRARVITVGSRSDPRLGPRHEHRGMVSRGELADLYRRSSVGLSMSASNPSRVPFEMMATGVPVVELGGWHNSYDLPPEAVLLAHPDPFSVAGALDLLLRDDDRRTTMAEAAVAFMQDRPAVAEQEAFVSAVDRLLAGESAAPPSSSAPRYDATPFAAAGAPPWAGGPQPGRWASRRRRLLGR